MANFVSPGTYVVEKDFSEFAPTLNSSVAGIVGFASKGPLNKATLITSVENLLTTFGRPDLVVNGTQAILGAIEILSRTDQLYFVRVATSTSAGASANVSLAACPAVYVSGRASENYTFRLNVSDHTGTIKETDLDIPCTSASTASGLIANIASAFNNKTTGTSPFHFITSSNTAIDGWIVNSYAGSGSQMSVAVASSTTFTGPGNAVLQALNASGAGLTAASSVVASGFLFDATAGGGVYGVESLYPGRGYNVSTLTDGTIVGNSVTVGTFASKNFTFTVNDGGAAEETFTMNMENGNAYYPETVLNTGSTNTKSEWVKASFKLSTGVDVSWTPPTNFYDVWGTASPGYIGASAVTAATPRFVKMLPGTYSLSGGANGDSATLSDTSATQAFAGNQSEKTGVYALDDDSLNISFACIPGNSVQAVQNELITLAENTENFIAAVSPPESLTSNQVIEWHNGKGHGRTASINSSYAAIYWPWVQIYDVFAGDNIWVDPTPYALSVFANTDNVADPWQAPAGIVRGRLTKPLDVQSRANLGERNTMYSGGNAINPIVKFPQDGIVIFGQRTSQRTPTALDRVNVRRMMIYVRKQILASTRAFIFEPNDQVTWSRVEATLNPMLNEISRRRGITEFRVICDSTTNTPLRIDRNELWCRVLIKPTKTAEVLVFEVNLTNQSAQLG